MARRSRICVLTGALGLSLGGCSSLDPAPLSSPLLTDRSAVSLAADLDAYVPGELQRRGVPGASVAVVHDGTLLFAAGYGIADLLTGSPVTPQTVFEVASHSKPVVAYALLRQVGAGTLHLDAPAADFLDPSLAPTGPHGARITLRHLLSHSAGLSNLGVGVVSDRRVWSPPGERFSYSGHGYTVLGRVLEQVSGEDLVDHLERNVLDPLGMSESGYRLEGARGPMARPHLPVWAVAGGAAVLLLVAALPIFALGWSLRRLTGRGFRPAFAALAAASALLALALGTAALGMATAAVGFGMLALLLAPWVLAAMARRYRGGKIPRWALTAVAACWIALTGLLVTRPALPLPRRQLDIAAAGGLLATAPDLARLLAELMDPRGLPAPLAHEMTSAQVRIDDELAWGLGVGLQRTSAGDAVWHWGQNPGFESLMVGYPDARLGVVVLTNGGPPLAGLALARDVAHRAIGGEHGRYWMAVPGTGWPASDGVPGGP